MNQNIDLNIQELKNNIKDLSNNELILNSKESIIKEQIINKLAILESRIEEMLKLHIPEKKESAELLLNTVQKLYVELLVLKEEIQLLKQDA